jgi:UDP-glucose 4-epimerase
MRVLVTGGAGFIGSTVVSALLDAGHEAVILDDLSTGARAFTAGRDFVEGDIADGAAVARAVGDGVDATVHCAAAIVVPESVAEPLRYYENNVGRTIDLLGHLHRLGCRRLLFSSSAAIYRPGADFTVDETSPVEPGSPYAATKAAVEQILRDVSAAGLTAALSLRYFNPVGADPRRRSGLQLARPTHALGRLIEAYEQGSPFTVTGTRWPTRDGSGIRDFIHVWDLARAHVSAIEGFDDILPGPAGYDVINVGTGTGTTVRELVAAFEAAVGRSLAVVEGPPRPGDVAGSYTRNDKARRLLGWQPELSIEQAVRDAVEWSAIRTERLGS